MDREKGGSDGEIKLIAIALIGTPIQIIHNQIVFYLDRKSLMKISDK